MNNLVTLYSGAVGDVVQCELRGHRYIDGLIIGRSDGGARFTVMTPQGQKHRIAAHEIINNVTQRVQA